MKRLIGMRYVEWDERKKFNFVRKIGRVELYYLSEGW